jgi:hypothetical protein
MFSALFINRGCKRFKEIWKITTKSKAACISRGIWAYKASEGCKVIYGNPKFYYNTLGMKDKI